MYSWSEPSAIISEAFKDNLTFKNSPGQGIGEMRGPHAEGRVLFLSFHSTITSEQQQQQQQLY